MKKLNTFEKRMDKMLSEGIKPIKHINESKASSLLKSLKRNQFPENWTLKDMVDRYQDDIFDYIWVDKKEHMKY